MYQNLLTGMESERLDVLAINDFFKFVDINLILNTYMIQSYKNNKH